MPPPRAGTNVKNAPARTTSVLHRTGVTAIDKVAVPTAVTVADVATGGSLLAATTYNVTWAAGTPQGITTVPANGSVTTASDASNTHVARVTTTQVTGATYYDLFLSTGANPLWVARVTEAQRAAGVTVTAVGTVTATSPGANKIDIRVVGTGVASNAAPFTVNNAYVFTGITPVDCRGATTALIYNYVTVTDLRSAPTLNFSVWTAPMNNTDGYVPVSTNVVGLLTAIQRPLTGVQVVNVQAASQLIVAVDAITGQGAAVDFWVDLV